MVKCNSCKYSSKFTNGLILCDFLKTKICVTANHTCKYGKPEEKMKNLINERPEQDIDHCGNCIHSADGLEVCVLRTCKYAIGELIDCYEPKQLEQRWIPVTERLPENGRQQVLVYARNVHYALAKYDEMREADGSYKKQWVTFDAWKPFYTIKEVIAWMPLPEPYREGGEQE